MPISLRIRLPLGSLLGPPTSNRPPRPQDGGRSLDLAQEFGDAILGYRTWPPSRQARTVPTCATRLSVTSDLNPAPGRPPANDRSAAARGTASPPRCAPSSCQCPSCPTRDRRRTRG